MIQAADILERLADVQRQMGSAGLDLLLVGPSDDFQYVMGYTPLVTERLTALLVPQSGKSSVVVPKLEAPNFLHLKGDLDVIVWDETESPIDHCASIARSAGATNIGINDYLLSAFLIPIQQRLPGVNFHRGASVFEPLRLIKSPGEVDAMREASRRIDMVWEEFASTGSLVGKTENEVAACIKSLMFAHGFSTVGWCDVGGGPNGASPLHHGSDRVIQSGEPVVMDFAGVYEGYYADICRTPVAGEPDPEFVTIYDIVREAQEQAFQAVRPGVPAQDIDRVARGIISAKGYGKYFLHRVGHGIGLSAHEQPYIVEGNERPLQVGMVFSDEPGIYIPDRWGVRIEDILVVTENGAERLNAAPRELISMS